MAVHGEAVAVIKLRVTEKKLLAAVKAAASSSSNIVFLPPLEKRSMAGAMNFHQAIKCLRDGSIVGKPVLNEHGEWELTMERYAANQLLQIKIIAICDGASICQLIVLN